jgi:hypothetical protein
MINLLEKARPPITNQDEYGEPEAYFLSGKEAYKAVEDNPPGKPIITCGEQGFRWPGEGRPIEQLFRYMENVDRAVSIQVPSRPTANEETSFDVRSLRDAKNRFMAEQPTADPWNLLDLQSPLPRTCVPNFLTGENTQLLSRMRDSALSGDWGQRLVAKKNEWRHWKDVEEWVLLSEAGHNTAPHMDSNGFSTWLSLQEGQFGVGWLEPTDPAEREHWVKNTWTSEGTWRFIVLRPRHTIFFCSGTIHFVFRLQTRPGTSCAQTLAVGGHVLQWSGILRWLDVLETQIDNPEVTNEEMNDVKRYVESMVGLVKARKEHGELRQIGTVDLADMILARAKVRFRLPASFPASFLFWPWTTVEIDRIEHR